MRGPANRPKDAIAPLSGLVETDWVSATFTMNWQFTRPHTEVIFDRGEPMCAVTPQRRGELAAWEPQVTAMGDVEKAPYEAFRDGRSRWAEEKLVPGTPASTQLFARHYMHGESEDGMRFDFHERKLRLKRFAGRPETEPRQDRQPKPIGDVGLPELPRAPRGVGEFDYRISAPTETLTVKTAERY